MNILKGNVLKVFGAVVLVSMIGALVAEPVALGDIGQVYMAWNIDKEYGQRLCNAGQLIFDVGTIACCTGVGSDVGLVLLATGVATMA
ncbi:MAG: hypothetical protein HZY31_00080 [Methanocaldococcus sp.]|nr:hypothetical protein [Methanocaldococcus sp.]